MDGSPQFWVIVLSVLLALGFLWGLVVNRRLGRQLYRRFRKTLEGWGTLAQARWLGGATSGVYMAFQEAPAPLRRFEAILLLEPREFLPIWLVARWLRGQRDALILRAVFRRAPHTEWEWRIHGFRPVRGFPAPRQEEGFTPYRLEGYLGWSRPAVEEAQAAAWQPFLQRYRGHLRALSLRKAKPHLILQVHLQGLDEGAFLHDLMDVLKPWL